jgi:hypothetical protein
MRIGQNEVKIILDYQPPLRKLRRICHLLPIVDTENKIVVIHIGLHLTAAQNTPPSSHNEHFRLSSGYCEMERNLAA